MRIVLNGKPSEVKAARLDRVLEELGYQGAKVATAVNGAFVARQARAGTQLGEGDALEGSLVTESLAEEAYGALRTAIAEGRLPPGSRIGESAFAEQLGISRTPVREALQCFARDGLISLDARNGARVAELSLDAILELYDLREILEGSAGRLAALNAKASDLQRLNAILEREAAQLDDPAALAKLNKLYHQTLCEAANNRYLSSAVATFSATLLLLGPTTLAAKHRGEESHAEHRAVVEAVASGDADRAEALMRGHIHRAREIRLAMALEEGLGV